MSARQGSYLSVLKALDKARTAILSSLSVDEVCQTLVDGVTDTCNATGVWVLEYRPETETMEFRAGTLNGEKSVPPLSLSALEGPIAGMLRDPKTTFIPNVQTDPEFRPKELASELGVSSTLLLPLVVRDRTVGLMAVYIDSLSPGNPPSQELTDLLTWFADKAAIALEHARLYQQEVEQHRRLRTIMDNLPEIVLVVDAHGHIREANAAALTALGAANVEEARRSILEYARELEFQHADGTPLPIEELFSPVWLRGEVVRCDEVWVLRQAQRECWSVVGVPLGGHNEDVVGGLLVVRDITQFKEFEKTRDHLLSQLADAHARLRAEYREEHHVAVTLQKSFLPDVPPTMANLELGHRYCAAADEVVVGGDFYDVMDLGSGKLGFLIGDVSGKGVQAAVYGAMVKYIVHAFAAEFGEPSLVMQHVNDAVCRYVKSGMFCTVFYGIHGTETGEFRYTNAGHDPPVLVTNGGQCCSALDVGGRAVGAWPGAAYQEGRVALCENDFLVLYTDGVTEARRGSSFFGEDSLRGLALDLYPLPCQDAVDTIVTRVQDFADGRLRDDVAVLAMKVL